MHDPETGTDVFDERLPEDFVRELYAICDSDRCVATVTVADEVLLKLDGEPDRSQMPDEMRWVTKLFILMMQMIINSQKQLQKETAEWQRYAKAIGWVLEA